MHKGKAMPTPQTPTTKILTDFLPSQITLCETFWYRSGCLYDFHVATLRKTLKRPEGWTRAWSGKKPPPTAGRQDALSRWTVITALRLTSNVRTRLSAQKLEQKRLDRSVQNAVYQTNNRDKPLVRARNRAQVARPMPKN